MTDPSRITLVISAPKQTPDNEKTLQALAQRWSEGKSSSTTPLERLFTPSKASKAKGSGSLRQTQIKRVKTKIKSPNDRITWIATRRLALKSAKARAYARLAQRTLQHEFDVRLVVHQGTGIWQLRTELSPNPERAAKELRIHLGQLDKALHEGFVPGRARQAARTWLGARLVENSLQGEDWTDLWSESLDLSQNLKTLPTAMQRNGAIMMGANAEEFQRWMHENIDPSLAKGPWMSEIVFANPKAVTALNRARMQAPPED